MVKKCKNDKCKKYEKVPNNKMQVKTFKWSCKWQLN